MTTVETHKFSNGLSLTLEKLPGSRSTGIAVGFPAGGRTENAKVSGISHYLEHMMFKGTPTIKKVDKTFQRFGANINGMTEDDSTVYVAECPKETALKTLGTWLQILSDASIDPEEFERERGVILSEYFITEDDPDSLVEKNAYLSLFKGHSLASTVIGTEDTIKAISHRDMLDYFHHWYHPSNTVIWVSGDLTMDKLINSVEQQENWTKHEAAHTVSYQTFKPKTPATIVLHRETKLAQIGLALSSPTQSADERASLQILGSMLSAGQSSMLRRKLILEDEFTNSLRTFAWSYREAGIFFTTFAIKPSTVHKVLTILTKTMHDMRENIAKFKEDFENAQSHAAGSFSASIDRRMMWRALLGAWEMLRRGQCSWDELISSLESLNFAQFKDNVTEITRPERVALILAGNIKKGASKTSQW
jgi:predicted Zn-dependent peptidase